MPYPRPVHLKVWHGHHTRIRHSSKLLWSKNYEKKASPGSNFFAACGTDGQRTSWNYMNSSSGSLRNDKTARPRRPWAKLSRRGLRFVFCASNHFIVQLLCFACAFMRSVFLFSLIACILRNMPRHFHEGVFGERLLWLTSQPSVLSFDLPDARVLVRVPVDV